MQRGEVKLLSDEIEFHDSSIVNIEIAENLDQIKIVVFSPYGGSSSGSGGFYELIFDAVLRFNFETTLIGESNGQPLEIYDIYLLHEGEWEYWKKRTLLLHDPRKFGLPKHCYPLRSTKGYDDVFHVVLASSTHRSLRSEEQEGLWIICRHITINDVTNKWPQSKKHHSATEPSTD